MKMAFDRMRTSGFAILLLGLFMCSITNAMAGDKVHNITFVNNCEQTIWVGQDGTIRDGWK